MAEADAQAGSRRRERSSPPDCDGDHPTLKDEEPKAKKARLDPSSSVTYTLYVRWFGPSSGQTKVTALPLRAVSGVDALPVCAVELRTAARAPRPVCCFHALDAPAQGLIAPTAATAASMCNWEQQHAGPGPTHPPRPEATDPLPHTHTPPRPPRPPGPREGAGPEGVPRAAAAARVPGLAGLLPLHAVARVPRRPGCAARFLPLVTWPRSASRPRTAAPRPPSTLLFNALLSTLPLTP
jgi:hypothetical protein